MIEGIAQSRFVLAESGWGELIFFVVIMLFSVFGSVIKSIAAKKQKKKLSEKGPSGRVSPTRPAETWQQRLARKAEEFQRTVEAQYRETQQYDVSARTQKAPEPGKLVVRTDSSGESLMVYEKDDSDETMTRKQAQRQRQAREAVAASRRAEAKRLSAIHRSRSEMAPSVEQTPEESIYAEIPPEPSVNVPVGPPVIDYNDPDALRKAILHYEILGKPLACRDPFESNSLY